MNKKEENLQMPAIVINSQYIKDMSLEIPHAPEIFKDLKSTPSIELNVDIRAGKIEDNTYNVALVFNIEGKVNDKHLFILELNYAAIVTLQVPEEHLEPVLMIEIPRLIFPFARSVITNSLSEAGLPPFMINPIDFVSMYNARKSLKN